MSDFARILALRILPDLEYTRHRTLLISTLTWTFTGEVFTIGLDLLRYHLISILTTS